MGMTLDEQIAGLEAFITSDAIQFKAKAQVLNTLRGLANLRRQFEDGRPDEAQVVRLILEVLGDDPASREKRS